MIHLALTEDGSIFSSDECPKLACGKDTFEDVLEWSTSLDHVECEACISALKSDSENP